METLSSRAASRLSCLANHVSGKINLVTCSHTNSNLKNSSPSQSQQRLMSTNSEKTLAAGSTCPDLADGVLRLYSMRFCPFAQRTRLVLEHKKIPYETVNVHLKNKPDWLLEKNPFGLVPILEKQGQIIYESTATCEWLDETYPEHGPRLTPSDPYRKAWDRILLENFGSLTARMRRVMFKPEQREKELPVLRKKLQFYDEVLKERVGPFFGGSQPAMIDFYLWPHMERVPAMATSDPIVAIDPAVFPHLAAWFEAMYKLPAVQATMFDIPTHLHFMASLAQGQPEYDYLV